VNTEMPDKEISALEEVTEMSATVGNGNIFYAIQEIFDTVGRGGAVRIKPVTRKKEEINAFLVAFIAGVKMDKFFTCQFSCREWNALLQAFKKVDEMDIEFVEDERGITATGKAVRVIDL